MLAKTNGQTTHKKAQHLQDKQSHRLKDWKPSRRPRRPSKRPERKRRKTVKSNKYGEKGVSQPLEVILKILLKRKTEILKILPILIIIKEDIILTNARSQKSQKTSDSLGNLYVNDCSFRGYCRDHIVGALHLIPNPILGNGFDK